ncbi:MAG: hypothetical protein LUG18_08170 [Candidatus Azobacteroides sp.]|nr:hypothetical protein [Candidatus Azobacteroides sp.]
MIRKLIKKITKVLFILFFAFFLFQVYFIIKNKGNLVLEISNDSLNIEQIEVYIDNKKVLDQFVLNEGMHIYNSYSLFISPTNHTLFVKVGDNISEKYEFNGFLATWVIINYYGSRFIHIDREIFYIDSNKLPLWWYANLNPGKNIELATTIKEMN